MTPMTSMRPRHRALIAALALALALVAWLQPVASYSDGLAGGAPNIAVHQRQCAEGFNYCKVTPAGCGGCHGSTADMMAQRQTGPGEAANVPVTDRIGGRVVVSGDSSIWEYRPGGTYLVEVSISFKNGYDDLKRRPDARPMSYGEYSKGGFTLNASAGKLSILEGDKTVRITGGNFTHYGTHNASGQYNNTDPKGPQRYGNSVDNETRHAGEATNTYEGSKVRKWQVFWKAPAAGVAPKGVAFMATVMVPNGDGWPNGCLRIDCNESKPYADQSTWDWWTFSLDKTQLPSVPRAVILCEKGAYSSRQACSDAVLQFVLPPTPPPNTKGAGGTGDGGEGVTPTLAGEALVALVVVAGVLFARRRHR
jgi:hypothetical protein